MLVLQFPIGFFYARLSFHHGKTIALAIKSGFSIANGKFLRQRTVARAVYNINSAMELPRAENHGPSCD